MTGSPASASMELWRALAVLAEPPGPEHVRVAELLRLPGRPDPAEYTELFILQLPPYASLYLGGEGMLGGEARDRVAGFWRALGRVPSAEPDHLTVMLALYAALAEQEPDEPDPARRALAGAGRGAWLWEHLACWLPPYLAKVRELAPPCYRAWAATLEELLLRELASSGRPRILPLHLRAAPPLPDPRIEGAAAFVQGLLAPVRSGVLLVRAELARAARETGLGHRIGERRRVLEALLAQDAARTLTWLEAEARAWARRHRRYQEATGPIADFWAARAEAAAALLRRLAEEQAEAPRYPVTPR
jgi:TorA maturation chaperone TorD